MVQVGPVHMSVLLRRVLVPMRMICRDLLFAMLMLVMGVIVIMRMLMRHGIVAMCMCMLFAEENHERDHNEPRGQCLGAGEGLPKNGHGQQ